MDPGHAPDSVEARDIMRAIRTLQTNPKLLDDARRSIPAVLDRLALSGTARHAVAAALALSVSGVFAGPGSPVFWSV
jgi:hypothetical protein